MLSEVTVNTKWGANAWKKRGAQHPWSLQRDQGPGLTGWTAPLKKAASDGVGLSGNELGRGPQAAQKRPSLRFWAAGEKGTEGSQHTSSRENGVRHPARKKAAQSCLSIRGLGPRSETVKTKSHTGGGKLIKLRC